MNDLLIQQLTERAKIYTNAAGETYKTNFKFEERFAKLIIDECIEELDAVKVEDYGNDDWDKGYDAGLTQAIETIKERFGIKE